MSRYIAGNDPGDEQPTPGPWVIDNRSVYEAEPAPNTGKLALGHVVADCPTAFGGHTVRAPHTASLSCPAKEVLDAQGLANARLIAAAPDLLEALKGLCFSISLRYGFNDGTDDEAVSAVERDRGNAVANRYAAARAAIKKAEGRS